MSKVLECEVKDLLTDPVQARKEMEEEMVKSMKIIHISCVDSKQNKYYKENKDRTRERIERGVEGTDEV